MEISKSLFSQIAWNELIQSGALRKENYTLLEKSQAHLGAIVDNAKEAHELAMVLLSLAAANNLSVKQYAFSRIEEILGGGITDYSDSDVDAFGSKNARFFTTKDLANDDIHLNDTPFVNALESTDAPLQKTAALTLACILNVVDSCSSAALIAWISSKLTTSTWPIALPALVMLVQGGQQRKEELAPVLTPTIAILKQLGRNGNAQQIYELCFVLWSLTLGCTGTGVDAFRSTGVVATLVEILSAAPSRKVSRMAIAALRNLCSAEDDTILTEMLGLGLLTVVDTARQSFKLVDDTEVDADFKYVQDMLTLNYRELSTFERWASEVRSGTLKWGILHTEKFWRENAKFVEGNGDFSLLKDLIGLLQANGGGVGNSTFTNPVAVCVALFDIGEFTRFYPNGRVVVSKLGGKDLVMQMLQRSSPTDAASLDPSSPPPPPGPYAEIEKHSLQCISKIMVSNWEFLR